MILRPRRYRDARDGLMDAEPFRGAIRATPVNGRHHELCLVLATVSTGTKRTYAPALYLTGEDVDDLLLILRDRARELRSQIVTQES